MMGTLNRNADRLLIRICEYYNKTGKELVDPLYTDLVVNGYITEPSVVSGEFRLLDRAINFAKNLK